MEPEKIIRENFILAFQIDNDELLDGLIEYHKNCNEYKYESEVTHDKEVKDSTDVKNLLNLSEQNQIDKNNKTNNKSTEIESTVLQKIQ